MMDEVGAPLCKPQPTEDIVGILAEYGVGVGLAERLCRHDDGVGDNA